MDQNYVLGTNLLCPAVFQFNLQVWAVLDYQCRAIFVSHQAVYRKRHGEILYQRQGFPFVRIVARNPTSSLEFGDWALLVRWKSKPCIGRSFDTRVPSMPMLGFERSQA